MTAELKGYEQDTTEELVLGAWAVAAAGEFEPARARLERALDRDRSNLVVWNMLAGLPGFAPSDDDLAAVHGIDVDPCDLERVAVRATTLATMYESLGRYDAAWTQIEEMNAALRVLRPYDASHARLFLDDVRTHLDAEYFASRAHLATATRPIFVIGLPRSGTTLVEQILASHPEVQAGGEMETTLRAGLEVYRAGSRTGSYVRSLPGLDADRWAALTASVEQEYTNAAGSASRVTDKMPANDHHLGLLAVMFPAASFVHVHRDPMDVCVSNYRLMYAQRHAQANDFESLAESWAMHRALMQHWRDHAPVDIMDLPYESLVHDQVGETKRLLGHCGLEWSDACLRFHERGGLVLTASNTQVRRPMYTTSIGAWRRYGRHLGGLRRALARVGATTA